MFVCTISTINLQLTDLNYRTGLAAICKLITPISIILTVVDGKLRLCDNINDIMIMVSNTKCETLRSFPNRLIKQLRIFCLLIDFKINIANENEYIRKENMYDANAINTKAVNYCYK